MQRAPVEDWVDQSGRVVLIGEAAHPMLVGPSISIAFHIDPHIFHQPCSTQSAGLAIEDAVVLGVLMSRLRTWEQIPQFLEAFQDLRQARCNHVRLSELHNAALMTLPNGPDRDMRDAAMQYSLNANPDPQWDDTKLREQYEEIGEVFGYNAREAAEDWWVKWGVLGDAKVVPDSTTKNLFSNFSITHVEILR